MIEIVPAILPENVGELRGKITLISNLVKTVQIDFCDGIFVPHKTWPYNGKDDLYYQKIQREEEGLPFCDEIDYEFDLMVKDATKKFSDIVKLGPAKVIFHLKAEYALLEFFENLEPYYKENIKFGIAVTKDVDIEEISQYVTHIDFIQCMGIEKIGFQNQPFDTGILELVKNLHERYPSLTIGVDGGVNLETGTQLVENGATKLVVGSAIFSSLDIAGKIIEFTHIA